MRHKHSKRVVLIGLDGAGKTTVLRQLVSRGAAPETLPTIGFSVQELVLDGLPLTVFDVGGQAKIRELWSQYARGADGLVLVVDSGDHSRLVDVRTELVRLLHGPANLSSCTVLVLANKQDQRQALAPTELIARLRLHEIEAAWHIEGTVGLDGTGIDNGFDWLVSHLSTKGAKASGWALLRSSRQAAWFEPEPESERRASAVSGQLRAMHSLAQELELVRVQNEQLAARCFALEQRNGELLRENANLRAAAGPAGVYVACGSPGTHPGTPGTPTAQQLAASLRGTPVSEVRRRALEARASAEALRKHNVQLAESLDAAAGGAAATPLRSAEEEMRI